MIYFLAARVITDAIYYTKCQYQQRALLLAYFTPYHDAFSQVYYLSVTKWTLQTFYAARRAASLPVLLAVDIRLVS